MIPCAGVYAPCRYTLPHPLSNFHILMSECDLFSLSSSMLKHHEVLVACCYPDADTGFHGFATYAGETIHSLVARVTLQSPWRP